MNLESPKVSVQKPASEIFQFLTKVENFEKIMPENTDKFEAQDESFLFALKGMPEIRLKLQEKIEHNKIVLGSTSEKFPFTLTGNISKKNDDSSEVQLIFEGKFNAMMAMMIKGPIQKFIDTLTGNIGKL
ncbi:MAG: SRPBCC family protein [Bacteroidia bacterium]|nr:SRPBCC family protein [Bacteroidia bacterium]